MFYVDKIQSFQLKTCGYPQLPVGCCKGLTRSLSCSCFAPSFNWAFEHSYESSRPTRVRKCYVGIEMVYFVANQKGFRFGQQRKSCDVTYASVSAASSFSMVQEYKKRSVCSLQVCKNGYTHRSVYLLRTVYLLRIRGISEKEKK